MKVSEIKVTKVDNHWELKGDLFRTRQGMGKILSCRSSKDLLFESAHERTRGRDIEENKSFLARLPTQSNKKYSDGRITSWLCSRLNPSVSTILWKDWPLMKGLETRKRFTLISLWETGLMPYNWLNYSITIDMMNQ